MSDMDEQATVHEDGPDDRRGAIYVTAVALVVFGLICGSMALTGGDDGPGRMNGRDDAERQCQEWAQEQLKAPATANFTTTSETGGELGPWTFSGTVDAENSFGAKIRNQWECEIRTEGEMWKGRARVF